MPFLISKWPQLELFDLFLQHNAKTCLPLTDVMPLDWIKMLKLWHCHLSHLVTVALHNDWLSDTDLLLYLIGAAGGKSEIRACLKHFSGHQTEVSLYFWISVCAVCVILYACVFFSDNATSSVKLVSSNVVNKFTLSTWTSKDYAFLHWK